jgi:RNA polymerase sigma-70 factor (ECF subfamily)
MTSSKSKRFFAALLGPSPAPAHLEEDSTRGIDHTLDLLIAEAESAWPHVRLDPNLFVERLARNVSAADPLGSLAALHASDLYLALACAEGDRAAMTALDTEFLGHIPRYVAGIDPARAFADEVQQEVREKLLVRGESGRAKIDEYTGKGPLGGFLRVAAIRTALNLRRGRKPQLVADAGLEAATLPAHAPDPEIDYLKTRYRREFREAFVLALSQLSPDERNVLRLHHLDGLTLEETAAVCRIHRATAARWLAEARERILKGTHKLMTERLHLNGAEVESVLRLIQSQCDVSIHRYLEEPKNSMGG